MLRVHYGTCFSLAAAAITDQNFGLLLYSFYQTFFFQHLTLQCIGEFPIRAQLVRRVNSEKIWRALDNKLKR